MSETKSNINFAYKFTTIFLKFGMNMTIKTFRLALLLAPILLMSEKFPRNEGGHFLFHKSQLDSRPFGVAGLTRF